MPEKDSRYAVGWMLAQRESADLATRLIEESIDKQQVCKDQRSRQRVLEAAYAAHPERFVSDRPRAPSPPQETN